MAAATLSPADVRKVLLGAARGIEIRESFSGWIPSLTIQSDDPDAPGPIPWNPYLYQAEFANLLQSGTSLCVLKSRQMGITWELGAHKLWAAAHKGWSCAYVSLGEDEARLHLGTPEVRSHVKWLWSHIPENERPRATWTADNAQFPITGGLIRVFPSTEKAGTSFTFQLVVLDEFAKHPHAAANLAAIAPTTSAGGQIVVTSTANHELGSAGAFYDAWAAANNGDVSGGSLRQTPGGLWIGDSPGTNGLLPVFIPWHARPGRDQAWLERERAKINDPARADAEYPDTPAMAFVGRSGLVFPQFARERHLVSAAPIPWAACRARAFGIDVGGGDPTAIVPLGLYQKVEGPSQNARSRLGMWAIHQFGEFYERGAVPLQDVAGWCSAFEKQHGATATMEYLDAGSGTVGSVATMRALGRARCQPGFRDPVGRRQWTADLLDDDRLTIDAACTNSIAEFAGYRWLERTDPNSKERYKTGTPVEHHADAMDARGEAIIGLMRVTGLTGGRTITKVAYPERVTGEEKVLTLKEWREGERDRRRAPLRRGRP